MPPQEVLYMLEVIVMSSIGSAKCKTETHESEQVLEKRGYTIGDLLHEGYYAKVNL